MSTAGYGTGIAYGDSASYKTSAWTDIANVIEITPPSVKVSSTDTKHLKSPNQAVTKKPSWKEAGDVALALWYDKDQMATLYGMAGDMRGWKVTLADGSTVEFDGFLSEIGDPVDIDDDVKIDLTITVSGLPEFTAAT